ncbi:hypothetical protein HMPREF9154_2795 [Arachnia propionica F0230a]|nr:hypothetical protein HMPREF9154_2795 [Arachnia propionica F0230a]
MIRPASVSEQDESKPHPRMPGDLWSRLITTCRHGFDTGRSFVAARLNQLVEGMTPTRTTPSSRPGSTTSKKTTPPPDPLPRA